MKKRNLPVETLTELYTWCPTEYRGRIAYATKKSKEDWQPVRFEELYEQGNKLASALISLGVDRQTPVAVLSDNCYEWALVDCGIQLSGSVIVPRGADISEQEIAHILPHSEASLVFVENANLLAKLKKSLPFEKLPATIILMKKTGETQSNAPGDCKSLDDLLRLGEKTLSENEKELQQRLKSIRADDLFTIIYTSGTTGYSKGVMLTHGNAISQLKNLPIVLSQYDRVLSVLPVWHAFERVIQLMTFSCGACCYYTTRSRFAEDLLEVQPTFMASVPRLWEVLYQKTLLRIGRLHPMRRFLFRTASFFSRHFRHSSSILTGKNWENHRENLLIRWMQRCYHAAKWIFFLAPYGLFNAAVMESVRIAMGGCFKGSISGGGALAKKIDLFYNNVGVPVLEGYGMTETSPVIAVRPRDNIVIQTVGPLVYGTGARIRHVETGETLFSTEPGEPKKFNAQGELWVKGPQVMKGYFKDSQRTAQVLKDGWLNTGDLAAMTVTGCLRIVGRTKDTIVLQNGENVEPEPLELALNQSPLIEHSFVFGQDQPHLGALIIPSETGFRQIGLSAPLSELAMDEKVIAMIQTEVSKRINEKAGFKKYERLKAVHLLPEPFAVGEEMTPLLKLKRHTILKKYEAIIEKIFKNKRRAA